MKILFIGDGYPMGKEAGSVLYQRILKSYGINNFCYYGVGYRTRLKWPEDFVKMPRSLSSLRIWSRGRISKYLKRIPLVEELYYFFVRPFIILRVNRFIKRNNIDLIFAVLRADVLAIINKVSEKSNLPLLGFISDTVEAEYGDKPKIYRFKLQEYLRAIQNSQGIYVAGEAMDDYIKNKFNKPTSILRLGFYPNFKKAINGQSKEIKIFFSGSVYAQNEFEIFVNALSTFSRKYSDYILTLITATSYKIESKNILIKIVNLGWVSEEELIEVMQESYIGYVPYKFDESSATQMTYAFPNKTGFYLSTGLPIFFHGPVYSSMAKFFEKYQCGIHCSSLDQNIIIGHLEKMIFNKEFYNHCKTIGSEAFLNEFSIDVMKSNFQKLIPN